MEIAIISAIAKNGIIGNKSTIPWHIKEDFQRFKRLTSGYPCIMGDVTYESLPDKSRPLPGRENIILTLDKNYAPKERSASISISHDFSLAIEYIESISDKAFIIGGATIYKLGLKYANVLELTRIHESFDGDTYFPIVNYNEWKLVSRENLSGLNIVDGKILQYSNERYERI